MQPTALTSAGRQKTVRERACVLYDRDTGLIRHIQHVIVMEGGRDPDEHEIEAKCRKAMERQGRPHHGLEALHLDRSALQHPKWYRVDPKTKMLEELKLGDFQRKKR